MKRDDPLLSAKELARKLARHPTYVYAAAKRGMPHVDGRFDFQRSSYWLIRNRHPRSRR
jgi:hypothetical protein